MNSYDLWKCTHPEWQNDCTLSEEEEEKLDKKIEEAEWDLGESLYYELYQ